MALNYLKSLPKYEKKKASQIFDYCLPDWEDFLQKSLVFDPRKRMTIDQAIAHAIFDGIRNMDDFDFPQGEGFDICLPSEMPIEKIKAKMNAEILFYRTEMDIEDQYEVIDPK